MVKGNTRQVIVVKAPETKLFEQAIFLLKEDAIEKHGVSERELLAEAYRAANETVSAQLPSKHILSHCLWTLAGAVPVAAAWAISVIFF